MTNGGQMARVREQFTRQAEAYATMPQTRDEAGMRLLVALAGTRPLSLVLDVACGPGFLTLAFAEACASARGIDATPAFVEGARRLAGERSIGNVSFELGDANALPEPNACWDIVACRAAFHHFPDPASVLAEMSRVAKPGGTLLVADLLGSELPESAALHDCIERLCDPTHTRALPLSEFSRLFRAQGLEVASQFGSEMHYDVEEWLAHGGPAPGAAAEIRSLLEASIEGDRADLAVQRVEGRLRFRHRTAAFVLRTPLA
jgi:ubiquinone/menaquinone biosynthesis C-methylase UbiE